MPFRVNGPTALAIPVSHVVPTFGYLLWDDRACVVFSSDTGPHRGALGRGACPGPT